MSRQRSHALSSPAGDHDARGAAAADREEDDSLRDVYALGKLAASDTPFLTYGPHASPMQAALLQRMQRLWGNRAVTSYLQRQVQRCGGGPCACHDEAATSGPKQEQEAAPAQLQRSASPRSSQNAPHPATGIAVQRYSVPSGTLCKDVVPWLNSSSPYAPEWAETRCTYTFNGNAQVTTKTLPDGSIEKRARGHSGLTVSLNSPVDRPDWSPPAGPNHDAEAAAWSSMRATLDAHEQQHRQIGQTWRGTLETNWKALDVKATGTSDQDARNNLVAALQTTQQGWQSQAQAAQSAIDPFRGAVLSCPAPPPAPGGSSTDAGTDAGKDAGTDAGRDAGAGTG